MKTIPATAPEHWRGLLHFMPHSRALLIRDATGARFPLTPADCEVTRKGAKAQKSIRLGLWRREQRYGFVRCRWCGEAMTREQVTKDHLRARCFGGADVLANIVPACQPCNNRRSKDQARAMDNLRLEWAIAELRAA